MNLSERNWHFNAGVKKVKGLKQLNRRSEILNR
jgi:hypothetical protein